MDERLTTDISSVLTVRKNTESETPASVLVRQSVDHDFSASMLIRQSVSHDFPASMLVRQDVDHDFPASMTVKQYRQDLINAWMNIKTKDGTSSLDALLTIPSEAAADLPGRITIPARNKMRGFIEIIKPPVRTVEFTPIKDSSVREYAPTLSYGDYQQMLVGKEERGQFYAYIGFVIDLPKDIREIISIKLVLEKAYETTAPYDLGIYETDFGWQERTIIWDYQPEEFGKLGEFTVPTSRGTVEIDLMDIIGERIFELENLSLKFRPNGTPIEEEVAFYTKESLYPPKLVIEYHPVITYSNSAYFPALATVRAFEKYELPATILLNSNYYTNDLPTTIELAKHEHECEIDATCIVKQADINDLNSSVELTKKYRDIELDGVMIVPYASQLPGALFIEKKERDTELDAQAVLRAFDDSSLDAALELTGKEEETELDAIVRIRRGTGSELDASMALERKEQATDINAQFTVRAHKQNNLAANLAIEKKELGADIDAKIHVRRVENTELGGRLELVLREEENEIPASLLVKRTSQYDLDATLAINKTEDEHNLPARCEIVQKDTESELAANIYVRERWAKDLDAWIKVVLVSDIDASVTVRQKGETDISAQLNIPLKEGKSELSASMSIIKKERADELDASMTITKKESQNEIQATIKVRKDTGSYAFIM